MKSLLLALTILIMLLPRPASAQYMQQGQITYERKINVHSEIEEYFNDNSESLERVKAEIKKFKMDDFELYFTMNASVYKPVKKEKDNSDDNESWWGSTPADDNTVFTDFKTQRITANKTIFDKTFLVQDTMRILQWKLQKEIRTIDGYKCRKAVGKICDSVVVVAFFADDIMVSGGPEMFGGLPGMILELAIPRLHTTWNATKIEITLPAAGDITAPEKGKKTTEKELYETLRSSFSNWGKHANRNIWWSVL